MQAAFILLSVTYNLHSAVYGVRGGRGAHTRALAMNLYIYIYIYIYMNQLNI